MAQSSGANTYGIAKFVVSSDATQGNYTTIAAATAAAVSGDIIGIRPGTYTENLTLKSGISYVCLENFQGGAAAEVIIVGKMIDNGVGVVVTWKGIQFTTNSDFIVALTAGSNVVFNNCFLNCSNNTGISMGNALCNVYMNNSISNLGTTGIHLLSLTAGDFWGYYSTFNNSGGSLNTGTFSGGFITLNYCISSILFATSSTAIFQSFYSQLSATNQTILTTSGTGTHSIQDCLFSSGSSSAISVGTGTTLGFYNNLVNSSNTNAITGAGTIQYGNINFVNSSVMNVTTQTASYNQLGKWKASGQPSFLAYLNTAVNDVTGDGTQYTVIYDTEVYDQDNNFNLATGTFTAPVTGRYLINVAGSLIGGTIMSGIICRIVTSNRTYRIVLPLNAGITTAASGCGSVIADMDAADTFTITLTASDTGGKVDDAAGTASGELRNWVSAQLIS